MELTSPLIKTGASAQSYGLMTRPAPPWLVRASSTRFFGLRPPLPPDRSFHIVAIDRLKSFQHNGEMEKSDALAALVALSQETRLDICRLLVRVGPEGLPAGRIAEELGLPSATLAFHLKELKSAKLARCTRNGRLLIYAAEFPVMNALLLYLRENCCGRGVIDCPPACVPNEADTQRLRRGNADHGRPAVRNRRN